MFDAENVNLNKPRLIIERKGALHFAYNFWIFHLFIYSTHPAQQHTVYSSWQNWKMGRGGGVSETPKTKKYGPKKVSRVA